MKMFLLSVCLLAAACAPIQNAPPPEHSSIDAVRFSVERVSATTVRLMLDNGAEHRIGYNLCHSALERRAGDTWTQAGTSDVCTMDLRILNPGHDATLEKQLPATLPAGEYRYVTSIESPLGTTQNGITSDTFRIPG
ncbi:MAG TPA: hypothetical protein VF701_12310 [Thermoanaerobaculia bacterium]